MGQPVAKYADKSRLPSSRAKAVLTSVWALQHGDEAHDLNVNIAIRAFLHAFETKQPKTVTRLHRSL